MSNEQNLQKIIDRAFQDPISKLLLDKSNLTAIQYETLLIDTLIDLISDEKVSFLKKTGFRRKKVNRGSFSRTLSQARKRVTSSIFTIILLSYIGMLEEGPFNSYLILAEKLKDYNNLLNDNESRISKISLSYIEKELIEGIDKLAKPSGFKIL